MASEVAPPAAPRRRDADASRKALLNAASTLFSERGYEGTTLRDVAERAGVDAALVARYFGGKESLYRAAIDNDRTPLEFDTSGSENPDLEVIVDRFIDAVLNRWESDGIGPVALALTRPGVSDVILGDVVGQIESAFIEPFVAVATAQGLPDPQLRAELIVGAFVGVGTTRYLRSMRTLAATDREAVVALLRPMLLTLIHADL